MPLNFPNISQTIYINASEASLDDAVLTDLGNSNWKIRAKSDKYEESELRTISGNVGTVEEVDVIMAWAMIDWSGKATRGRQMPKG